MGRTTFSQARGSALVSRRQGRPRRRGCFSTLVFILLLLIAWLFRAQIFTVAASALVKEDQPVKADAIVVLGGDGYGTRIVKGAELATQGYAPIVWVSEGVDILGHGSFGTIQYVELYGYPASLFHPVFLPPEDDSTRGEAAFMGKLLKAANIHSIVLVTSNFHTRRAGYLWRKENPWLKMTVVGSSDPYFSTHGWWKTRAGQKTFLLEWMKTISSRLGD